jgi:hypothetical protein
MATPLLARRLAPPVPEQFTVSVVWPPVFVSRSIRLLAKQIARCTGQQEDWEATLRRLTSTSSTNNTAVRSPRALAGRGGGSALSGG